MNAKSSANYKKRYDILQNSKGDILIMIDSYNGGPENPRIVYDGNDKLVLYRSRESIVLLDNIDIEARPYLKAVSDVLIVEFEGDDSAREYKAPVRIVKSLEALL